MMLDPKKCFQQSAMEGERRQSGQEEHPELFDQRDVYITEGLNDHMRSLDTSHGGWRPQGSILGPLLWNINYEEVLRLHRLASGINGICGRIRNNCRSKERTGGRTSRKHHIGRCQADTNSPQKLEHPPNQQKKTNANSRHLERQPNKQFR